MPEDDPVTGVTTSATSAASYRSPPSAFSGRTFTTEPTPPAPQILHTPSHGLPQPNARYQEHSPISPDYQHQKPNISIDTASQGSSRFPPHREGFPSQSFEQSQLVSSHASNSYQPPESSSYYHHSGYYPQGPGNPYSSPEQNQTMAAAQMRSSHQLYHGTPSISPSHASHDMSGRNLYSPPNYNANMYLPMYGQSGQQPSYQYQSIGQDHYSHIPAGRPSYNVPGQHTAPPQSPGINSAQGLVQGHVAPRGDWSQIPSGHMASIRSPSSGPPVPNIVGGPQSSAAPGPIPATTPLVIKHDSKGVKHIEFEYSRDRIKTNHNIRCDIDSVNQETLTQKFKEDNCVYPRACGPKSAYTGNRYAYETECNEIGWALASLNQPLQGRRGLIQRAVDSWRNSNADVKMRSRRVRRLAKNQKRNQQQQFQHQNQQQNTSRLPGGVMIADRPGLPPQRHSLTSLDTAHYHQPMYPGNRHPHSAVSAPGSGMSFQSPSQGSRIAEAPLTTASSAPEAREVHAHDFYAAFPPPPSSVPATGELDRTLSLDQCQKQDASQPAHETTTAKSSLHGEGHSRLRSLPESIPRSYSISVKDNEQQRTPRAKFDIDNVDVGRIEESYRAKTAVWPRSFVSSNRLFAEGDWEPPGRPDMSQMANGLSNSYTTAEYVDGSENSSAGLGPGFEYSIKEKTLNDIGSQLSHGKPRTFDQRPLLLQKALDECRAQLSTHLVQVGEEVPTYLQQRVGKQLWHSRSRVRV